MFIGKQKNRMNGEFLRQFVQKAATEVGVHKNEGELCERFSPHCFRHWYTSVLLNDGLDGAFVDELRGDSRSRSRDVYHQISDEVLIGKYRAHMPELNIKIKIT